MLLVVEKTRLRGGRCDDCFWWQRGLTATMRVRGVARVILTSSHDDRLAWCSEDDVVDDCLM